METRTRLRYLRAYKKGLESYQQKHWAEAVAAFNEADSPGLGYPELDRYRAKALEELKILTAANKAARKEEQNTMSLTRLDESSSKSGYPAYLRGLAFYEENDFVQAKRELVAAISNGYDDANMYYLLGCIEHNNGNEMGAIGYFQRSISSNPQKVEAYLQLGVIQRDRGEYVEAEAFFAKVLASANVYNTLALMHEGVMYHMLGESAATNTAELKIRYFQNAVDRYNKILDQPEADLPLHLLLRTTLQLLRTHGQVLKRKFNVSVDTSKLKLNALIDALKVRDAKTVEERCILFMGQAAAEQWNDAWETFIQLLGMHKDESDSLYDRIPAYLKRDLFSVLVTWPVDKIQKMECAEGKTEEMKLAIVNLLKTRDGENYPLRILQINVGLLALTLSSPLGAVLYVQQGYLFSPGLGSGKLGMLVAALTQGIIKMEEQQKAGLAGPMRLCESTKKVLETQATKDLFKPYPPLYEVVFGVSPPVPEAKWSFNWFRRGVPAAAAAAASSSLSMGKK